MDFESLCYLGLLCSSSEIIDLHVCGLTGVGVKKHRLICVLPCVVFFYLNCVFIVGISLALISANFSFSR